MGGSKGATGTPASAAESKIAGQIFKETEPVRNTILQQGLEAYKTGGVSADLPMVQRAIESSKSAMSDTLANLFTGAASGGLAGTPYAASTTANAAMQGGLATNQAANSVGQWFMNMIPSFTTGTTQTGAGLLQGAGQQEAGMAAANTGAKGQIGSTELQSLLPKAPQCCFIFLAADGYLHPVVRMYRDSHMSVRNRRGYCRLADRLVPLMERSRIARFLIRTLMTLPLTSYGKYYYGLNHHGFIFKPLESFWMRVFDHMGNSPPYTRKGTDEVV